MSPSRISGMWLGVLIALAGVLTALAALQYHWIGQLSTAEQERMRLSLDRSVRNFQLSFFHDILFTTSVFRFLDGQEISAGRVIQKYDWWSSTAPHTELVQDLYTALPGEIEKSKVRRLDLKEKRFRTEEAPDWLNQLWSEYPEVSGLDRAKRLPSQTLFHIGGEVVIVQRATDYYPSRSRAARPTPITLGYFVFRLDTKYLREVYLPEMAHRHFGRTPATGYLIAIRAEPEDDDFLFCEPKDCSDSMLAGPDYEVNLLQSFRPISEQPGPDPFYSRLQGPGRPEPNIRPESQNPPPGRRRPPAWTLLVKHSRGSVAAAAQSLRSKNLFLSAAILLLLAVTLALVIIWTRRVQRLAELQMEFVAGVSHELRTPLAVIRSAADNLSDGVVRTADKAVEYGLLLRNSSQRLSAMLEQTLQFAKVSSGTHRYNLQLVDPTEVVHASLSETEPMLNSGGFTVIQNVGPNLPKVYADRTALIHCLTNLLTNAIKYAGGPRWITVHAIVEQSQAGTELRIAVQDKGPGIHPEDLKLVFDPFYRGRRAKDTQAQGAGLGLSLTKKAIEAMGGYISVSSAIGQGATFMLHLPLLEKQEKEVELWNTVSS